VELRAADVGTTHVRFAQEPVVFYALHKAVDCKRRMLNVGAVKVIHPSFIV
jgi:hypothetical protein